MFNHKEDRVVCERCGCRVEESLSVMMRDCSVVCVECLTEEITDGIEEDYHRYIWSTEEYLSNDDY